MRERRGSFMIGGEKETGPSGEDNHGDLNSGDSSYHQFDTVQETIMNPLLPLPLHGMGQVPTIPFNSGLLKQQAVVRKKNQRVRGPWLVIVYRGCWRQKGSMYGIYDTVGGSEIR